MNLTVSSSRSRETGIKKELPLSSGSPQHLTFSPAAVQDDVTLDSFTPAPPQLPDITLVGCSRNFRFQAELWLMSSAHHDKDLPIPSGFSVCIALSLSSEDTTEKYFCEPELVTGEG